MLLQVHDELFFEVPEALVEDVKRVVLSEMQNIYPLGVPLAVSAGTGHTWDEAH